MESFSPSPKSKWLSRLVRRCGLPHWGLTLETAAKLTQARTMHALDNSGEISAGVGTAPGNNSSLCMTHLGPSVLSRPNRAYPLQANARQGR